MGDNVTIGSEPNASFKVWLDGKRVEGVCKMIEASPNEGEEVEGRAFLNETPLRLDPTTKAIAGDWHSGKIKWQRVKR